MLELLQEDVIKLFIAIAIGAAIGAEREYKDKSAGFRTITLISFASCLFTILSSKIGPPNVPDRIAANIVTGIGFLGAGAIFKADNRIGGLTTAATIWVSAAMGMCVGSGNILLAFEALGLIMIILLIFWYIEIIIDNAAETNTYKITCQKTDEVLIICHDLLQIHKIKVIDYKLQRFEHFYVMTFTTKGRKENHRNFVQNMINDESVKEFEY